MKISAKSVTFFALASLALSVACSNPVDKITDDIKRRIDDFKVPDFNFDFTTDMSLASPLAEPSADGISRNEFTIDLTTKKPKNGITQVLYYFKPADFKTMKVTLTSLQEEGCKQLPEIQSENGKLIYEHGAGSILGFNAGVTKIKDEQETDVKIDATTTQVISIKLGVDSSCQTVIGKVEVQFKK